MGGPHLAGKEAPAITNTEDKTAGVALKVIGAGAAGLGVLGLVTAVGGAIMFERFSQAGLPAEQAVAVQPRNVLLTVGAEALIPLVAAVSVVVALYLAASALWSRRHGHEKKDGSPMRIALFAFSGFLGAVVYYLVVVELHVKGAVLVDVVLVSAVASAMWGVLAMLAKSVYAQAAMLAVIMCLLGAAIGLIRTADAPKVRGAVVALRSPAKVLAGVYVAETSDQLFIGQVKLADPEGERPAPGTGVIIALDRANVTTLAFASNEGLPTALRQAHLMAAALRNEPDGASLALALSHTRRTSQTIAKEIAEQARSTESSSPTNRTGEATPSGSTVTRPSPSVGSRPAEQILPHASRPAPPELQEARESGVRVEQPAPARLPPVETPPAGG